MMKVLRLTHVEMAADGSGAFCFYPADQPDSLIEEVKEMQYCEVGEKWAIRFINPTTDESFIRWLYAWDYMTDHEHYLIKPDWLIMYLGEMVEAN